jgi:hypothetical protein
MAMVKPTLTDIAELQVRMAQVRHDMHQEVQSAVKGAQLLTDWRSLVKNFPWLSISVAALAGFALVPSRRSTYGGHVAAPPAGADLLASSVAAQVQQKRRTGWNVVGTAFNLLSPVVVRAAQNYALDYFEKWLSQHPLPPVPASAPVERERNGLRPDRKQPATLVED